MAQGLNIKAYIYTAPPAGMLPKGGKEYVLRAGASRWFLLLELYQEKILFGVDFHPGRWEVGFL